MIRDVYSVSILICLCVLSDGCALTKANTPARSPADIECAISGALPAGWDTQSEQPTPNQHVQEIKLVGPAPCWIGWKDKDGRWHEESVGREAITIMISTNRIPVTLFQRFKGLYTPLLYDGGTVFVYAVETSSITNIQREAQIEREAELYTGCGPSGEPISYLPWSYVSWRNWRSDLKRSFGTMHFRHPRPVDQTLLRGE
jgi:hypothetical protein